MLKKVKIMGFFKKGIITDVNMKLLIPVHVGKNSCGAND
jgi:hypothetical protein